MAKKRKKVESFFSLKKEALQEFEERKGVRKKSSFSKISREEVESIESGEDREAFASELFSLKSNKCGHRVSAACVIFANFHSRFPLPSNFT